jgi:pimeloyl-ACP methyl ester carboxylesterase
MPMPMIDVDAAAGTFGDRDALAPDLAAGLIPDARLKIYPDAAHGFLFQHHSGFAGDVDAFLAGA